MTRTKTIDLIFEVFKVGDDMTVDDIIQAMKEEDYTNIPRSSAIPRFLMGSGKVKIVGERKTAAPPLHGSGAHLLKVYRRTKK
jgi:hypothetical protein